MSSWATKSIIIYNLYPKVQNLPKLGQTMIRLGWTSQMYQLHQPRPQKAWEVGHPSVQPPVMAQKLSRDCKAFHRPAAVSAMLLLTGVSRWCDVYYHNNCWYHLNSVYLNCLSPFIIIVVVIETSHSTLHPGPSDPPWYLVAAWGSDPPRLRVYLGWGVGNGESLTSVLEYQR